MIDQILVNSLAEARTAVETKIQVALDKVRAQLDRFDYEKVKHQAEIHEKARLEVANSRATAEVPPQDPVLHPPAHFNKIVRFQPIESSKNRRSWT